MKKQHQKPEVVDLSNLEGDDRPMTVVEKWAMRESGLVIAAMLRYNDEHNARADALRAGTPEEQTTAPVLERLGYSLQDHACKAAAFAIQQCVRGDGQDPQQMFADQILDLRDLEKEGLEPWRELKESGFPAQDAPCPCGSRKTFDACCMKAWELEEQQRQLFALKAMQRKNSDVAKKRADKAKRRAKKRLVRRHKRKVGR